MKLKKNIPKILTLAVMLNNMCFHSNASSLNRYETLESEVIFLDNVNQEDIAEIEVFGNTIQNADNLEDIQSIGDLYIDEKGDPILDNQGRKQYKIEIESCNKNLFDINSGFDSLNDTDFLSKQWIYVKEGEKYVLSADILPEAFLYFYNSDKQYISRVQCTGNFFNKTIPKGISYIKVMIKNTYNWDTIQLEKNNTKTDFVPHQSHKTTILLPCQLMKVGNVADRLYWDSEKGKYVIEKNISKERIDSIYNVYHYTGEDNYAYMIRTVNSNNDKCYHVSYSHNYIINGFKDIIYSYYNPSSDYWTFDKFGSQNILIRFPREDRFSTVEKTLLYLADNDISIYFQNKVPELIETNITKKIKIQTYEGNTHVYINTENGINPTLKIIVDRIEQTSQEAVDIALSNPTSNNLALARMFVNMLPDSLYKDQLQAQLNNIFSSDIVLDKKIASSNLDLYIKSENILIMSLDTNTITFEDFSGTEDMGKVNAINLTVNSSLPYQVNAYLPNEIQNNDKSNTMSKDILNIKESSEPIYRTFANINEKVILKDNCIAGNGIKHSIDLLLKGGIAHEKDVYKTTIKLEIEQK